MFYMHVCMYGVLTVFLAFFFVLASFSSVFGFGIVREEVAWWRGGRGDQISLLWVDC